MSHGLGAALGRRALGFADRHDWIAEPLNRHLINRAVEVGRHRALLFGTKPKAPSWHAPTGLGSPARHLPPVSKPSVRPDVAELLKLFRRRSRRATLCAKSTCLFPAFAQYLADGLIRTGNDERCAGGQHLMASGRDIGLCPLYGRTDRQTEALRLKSEAPGRRGRLRSQMIHGEEYAPFLFRSGRVDPRFAVLDRPLGLQDPGGPAAASRPDPRRRDTLFAFGGDRANASPQVAMINTLLLREHNRLASEIEAAHPDWADSRIFETARDTLIVMFTRIVVEEYINHISPIPFRFRADPSVTWRAHWHRPNRISTEFSLLHRWHALMPDAFHWGGAQVPRNRLAMDNRHLIRNGLAAFARDLSAQPAAALVPFNTVDKHLPIEAATVAQGRALDLAPFSDYRAHFGLPRAKQFSDISSDPAVASRLASLYGHPAEVEFHIGLFMEDRLPDSPLPGLFFRMVAMETFSQVLADPRLSEDLFQPATFSAPGWAAIRETGSLADLVSRNTPGSSGTGISMTRGD